jgi:hypothetical protein
MLTTSPASIRKFRHLPDRKEHKKHLRIGEVVVLVTFGERVPGEAQVGGDALQRLVHDSAPS